MSQATPPMRGGVIGPHEVLRKYDAGNRLLSQAENEVLAQERELARLAAG